MNGIAVLELTRAGLFLVLTLVGPLLMTSLIVGVAIGLLQALTQIQEMTLTFVPKLGAVAFVLVILGASMMSVVADFTQDIFTEIARIGD